MSSECIRHEQCPRCVEIGRDTTGDNLAVYEDEEGNLSSHCFSCGYTVPSKEWLEENQDEYYWEEDENLMGKQLPFTVEGIKEKYHFPKKEYRGIRPEIAKPFGVMHLTNDEGELEEQIYATYIKKKLVGFKRRKIPKKFLKPYGEAGKPTGLWGQQLFLDDTLSRTLVVTEGSIDCLSMFQILKDNTDRTNNIKGTDYRPIPVVTTTLGVNGLAEHLKRQYEWLDRFEKIIVCVDNDEAGKGALEDISNSLPRGKMYVMELPEGKDVNDMLVEEREKDVVNAFFKAKPYITAGLATGQEVDDSLEEYLSVEKLALPPVFKKLNKALRGGIPVGSMVNICMASGVGKTSIITTMLLHIIFNSKYKPLIVNMESGNAYFGLNLLSAYVGKKITLMGNHEALEYLRREDIKEKRKNLFNTPDGKSRFILSDDKGSDVEAIKDIILNAVIKEGCRVIILDLLSNIIDGLSLEDQNQFVAWIEDLISQYEVIVICANQIRKSPSGKEDPSATPVEDMVYGTSKIVKTASLNLMFGRDKSSEDNIERNTLHCVCTKNRTTGITGAMDSLYYNNEENKFYNYDDWIKDHAEVVEF